MNSQNKLQNKVRMAEAAGLQSLASLEYWLVGAGMKRRKCCEGETLTGWGMGYDMELLENTECLTLKSEWMKYTNSPSAIYMG